MNNLFITTLGKTISMVIRLTNRGAGSTWPGHIALGLNKAYIKQLLQNSPTQIILVVGTNGKTTTAKVLTTILQKNNKRVFRNNSGANLLNGIASSLLLNTNFLGKLNQDYAIFEVDENNLPLVLKEITPKTIIVLDLFRDQLDRYGELDSIAKKWQEAFAKLTSSTNLILNADDPLIAYLGLSLLSQTNMKQKKEEIYQETQNSTPSISFFGLDNQKEENHKLQHAADSLYCPKCNNKLNFSKIFYSHLGIWKCHHCKLQRPIPNLATSYYPLEGTYNKYNTLAASLTAQALGLSQENIEQALHTVTPAFGRQEKLSINNKTVQIFLAKNPTSFNETLRTIHEKGAQHIVFVLNDRIPDGRDVSWIWDIDMEEYIDTFQTVTISGDRSYEMALRTSYAENSQVSTLNYHNNTVTFKAQNTKYLVEPNLKKAIKMALEQVPPHEILYILPTYSAMLEVRKILTGRRIL